MTKRRVRVNPCPARPVGESSRKDWFAFSIQFANQAEYSRRRAIVARAFQETNAMRKLILAALVAAAFSIPAFAAQTTPAASAPAAKTAAPAATPMKAEHKTKASHHHVKKHSASKHHHKAKKAEAAGAK